MWDRELIQWLWFQAWWTWDRTPGHPVMLSDIVCHYFNLCEAAVWFVFAALVTRRWIRFQKSPVEIVYAIAFVLFGISDVIEAWELTSWLLWWKAMNLFLLLGIRKIVMSRHYPDSRLF